MEKDIYTENEKKEIGKLFNQLKGGKITFSEVPEGYRDHPLMVKKERKYGMRRTVRRGYDIIRNVFFAEEEFLIPDSVKEVNGISEKSFATFGEYYHFLNGDIYENACYYQYHFSAEEIKAYRIDLKKINMTALIEETIDDFSPDFSENEIQDYEEREKREIKRFRDKLCSCATYEEFEKTMTEFREQQTNEQISYTVKEKELIYLIYCFIFSNKEKAYDIIQHILNNRMGIDKFAMALCSVYDPEKIYEACKFDGYSDQTKKKHKQRLREYIDCLKDGKAAVSQCSYFDKELNSFVKRIGIRRENDQPIDTYRFFDTFQELAEALNNDLSDCDLSEARLPGIDFSIYKVNANTKLPFQYLRDQNRLSYQVLKSYYRKNDRNLKKGFYVVAAWVDANGKIIKCYHKYNRYFFDFVYFLKNDLSDADLLFCDGLENLRDFSGLNLTNAKVKSVVLDRLGAEYPLSLPNEEKMEAFFPVLKNENETSNQLEEYAELRSIESARPQRVYYISDLHLLHQCRNYGCRTSNDIEYAFQRVIDKMLDGILRQFNFKTDDQKSVILIGGDTSSDFDLFRLFIKILRKSLNETNEKFEVIFLLGNHELWDFPNDSLEEIVQKYRTVIHMNGMRLLQNELLYRGDDFIFHKITAEELASFTKQEVRERTKKARLILFGGLAFSGCNEDFNANNGIYRATINRDREKYESGEFEKLYCSVCEALYDRPVIVFTHMPISCWRSDPSLQPGFVYVSGHTHRNNFYDDGDFRVYADNQIGYQKRTPALKCFYVDGEYDVFSDYEDGIHEITRDQYVEFYRGKNIQMDFNKVNVLYMLKKDGYYCFIHSAKNGNLTILNGGEKKSLLCKSIDYYYKTMGAEIEDIRKPLDRYTEIQKQISDEVKRIGGSGTIHGAIIDIDFYNHIFLNPHDLKITGYWASDIINKMVYPSIPKLLETECPKLYENYERLLKSKKENMFHVISRNAQETTEMPEMYFDTVMYSVSREVKKMQRLRSGILTVWYRQDPESLGYKLLE